MQSDSLFNIFGFANIDLNIPSNTYEKIKIQGIVKLSKNDSLSIVTKLFKQQDDWNIGDLDAFMEGYLNTEHLVFSGSSGPIYGWKATIERYKKTYSTRQLMGILDFEILNIISLKLINSVRE